MVRIILQQHHLYCYRKSSSSALVHLFLPFPLSSLFSKVLEYFKDRQSLNYLDLLSLEFIFFKICIDVTAGEMKPRSKLKKLISPTIKQKIPLILVPNESSCSVVSKNGPSQGHNSVNIGTKTTSRTIFGNYRTRAFIWHQD